MILERLPGSRFSRIRPEWRGQTVAIIGSGKSLTLDQVAMVRESGIRTIAVNASYLWAYFADVCYFADSHFWKWQTEGIGYPAIGFSALGVSRRWGVFPGLKCSIQNTGANVTDDAVHILRNKTFPKHGMGLSLDCESLITGRNSGFQSLNMAILAGASRVILLGFDGKAGHFHGGHPRPTPEAVYPLYLQAMNEAAGAIKKAGVEVLNASPESAITCFEKRPLEAIL